MSGIEKILNIFYWINEWVDKTNHLAAGLNSLMTFRLTGSRCFSEKSLLFGPQHGLPQTSFARGTNFYLHTASGVVVCVFSFWTGNTSLSQAFSGLLLTTPFSYPRLNARLPTGAVCPGFLSFSTEILVFGQNPHIILLGTPTSLNLKNLTVGYQSLQCKMSQNGSFLCNWPLP